MTFLKAWKKKIVTVLKNYNSKLLEAICEHKHQQERFMSGKKNLKNVDLKEQSIFFVHFFTHLSHVSSVRGKGGQEGVGWNTIIWNEGDSLRRLYLGVNKLEMVSGRNSSYTGLFYCVE